VSLARNYGIAICGRVDESQARRGCYLATRSHLPCRSRQCCETIYQPFRTCIPPVFDEYRRWWRHPKRILGPYLNRKGSVDSARAWRRWSRLRKWITWSGGSPLNFKIGLPVNAYYWLQHTSGIFAIWKEFTPMNIHHCMGYLGIGDEVIMVMRILLLIQFCRGMWGERER
jgi:hypothetical protein